ALGDALHLDERAARRGGPGDPLRGPLRRHLTGPPKRPTSLLLRCPRPPLCFAAPMTDTTDDLAWVKRVNSRWIVRQGLRESSAAYLDHLAATDPEKMMRSCRRARHLTHQSGSGEDPKPWFYAGLFSLATDEEASRFLAEHPFTLAALPRYAGKMPGYLCPDRVAQTTWEKVLRIRQGVTALDTWEREA